MHPSERVLGLLKELHNCNDAGRCRNYELQIQGLLVNDPFIYDHVRKEAKRVFDGLRAKRKAKWT